MHHGFAMALPRLHDHPAHSVVNVWVPDGWQARREFTTIVYQWLSKDLPMNTDCHFRATGLAIQTVASNG